MFACLKLSPKGFSVQSEYLEKNSDVLETLILVNNFLTLLIN